jgi:hypothetical protein
MSLGSARSTLRLVRALLLLVAVAQVACGWDYEVATVEQDGDVDSAIVEDSTIDSGSIEDTNIEGPADAADTKLPGCPDAAPDGDAAEAGISMTCQQCALSKCASDAIACNGDDVCNKWLTCAGACTCPRFPCYNACRMTTPSPLADKLLACMAMDCLSACN